MKSFSQNAHRTIGHSSTIALEVRDVGRLFNSMDPSPFEDKDLDSDAEEFIVSSLEEHLPDEALTLNIYLDEWPDEDPTQLIRDAIHNYFELSSELQSPGVSAPDEARPQESAHRIFVPCRLSSSQPPPARTQPGNVGRGREGEPDDRGLGSNVAAYGNLPLRLVGIRRKGQIYGRLSRIPVEVARKDRR